MIPDHMSCEEAFRRARAQKTRIALQREMIISLSEMGMTELLPPARRLLARLQGTDRLIVERLREVIEAQRTGQLPTEG